MPMLEGQVDAVIGVDTHRDRHAAALLDPNGGVRAALEVPSDRAAMPGCSSWPTSKPPAGGSGRWKAPAAMGPG
jgi:transposase